MRFIDHRVTYQRHGEEFRLYPFGDLHFGTKACHEVAAAKHIKLLRDDPNGLGFLGGDVFEAIPTTDPRFDRNLLAGWCRDSRDVVSEQERYAADVFSPVKEKLIGGIEGNHEWALRDHQGRDAHGWLCETLGVKDMTYSAFIRLKFTRNSRGMKTSGSSRTYLIHVAHGKQAGGVTAGAERNRLARRREKWKADLYLVGHSHWLEVLDDRPQLTIPRRGKLPDECVLTRQISANWGTFYRAAPVGDSSYAERAEYSPRDIGSVIATFRPDVGDLAVNKVVYGTTPVE